MNSSIHSKTLDWSSNGYEDFLLRANIVPGDGNCLIHAICYSSYLPYHTRMIDGKRVTRREIVRRFRDNLADKLVEVDLRSRKSNYDMLGLDYKNVPEYSLSSLDSLLRSSNELTMVIIFAIEKLLNINVFILDNSSEDIYVRDGKPNQTRPCVVVLYTGNHFDSISVDDSSTAKRSTYFTYSHPFIQHLEERRIMLKNGDRDPPLNTKFGRVK